MLASPLRFAGLALVLGLTACSSSGPPVPDDFSAVDAELQAFVDAEGLEGANFVVIDRDRGVIHQSSFGSFTPDRVSLLASSSKVLSVGVLMHLHEQGLLDIDAPLSDYMPEHWAREREYTAAQLLSNTSGMVGLIDDPLYAGSICQYTPLGDLYNCGRSIYEYDDSEDAVPPGTAYRYGGGQWQVAGMVAEHVSEKTWAELIEEIYVEPCGLDTLGYTNHYFSAFGSGGDVDSALTYPDFFDGDISTLPETINPNIEGGAYTTIEDYAQILWLHLNGGMCNGTRVLSEESVARMQADGLADLGLSIEFNPQFSGYGLGWFVSREEPGLVSDGGAYGAFPWIDNERGYAAMILVEDGAATGGRAYGEIKDILDGLFDAVR